MPHDNVHYWLRGYKRGTMSKQKNHKIVTVGDQFLDNEKCYHDPAML